MSQKIIRWKAWLKRVPGLAPLVRLCRILVNQSYRSEWLLQREKPDNLFQPVSQTSFDRYPRIFSFVKVQLSDIPAPRLLSFGCSTGDEVFTLRQYFPLAEIVGIDINSRSIARCRKRQTQSGDTGLRFELAGSPEAEPESYYDAIFCMAVLRHGNLNVSKPQNCSHLIRFNDFEKTVSDLCCVLKPGGLLVIRYSNFRFEDTIASTGFETVFSAEVMEPENTPLYGPDNQSLANLVYKDTVFYKRKIS